MRARAMASSFADALDLGAPPRPRRPPAPTRPGRASCWTWAAGGGRSLWPWPTPPRAQPSWPWTSMSAPSTSPPAMPPRPDTPTSTPPRPRPGNRTERIEHIRGPRRLFSGWWRGARGRRQVHGGALLLGPLKCGWTVWKIIPRVSVSSGSRRDGRRPHGLHGPRRPHGSRGGAAPCTPSCRSRSPGHRLRTRRTQ